MSDEKSITLEETDFIDLVESDLDETNRVESLIEKRKIELGRYSTKLTKEVFDNIIAYVKAGAYVTHAANACGIETCTFYKWLERGSDEPDSIYGLFRTEMMKAYSSAAIRNELIIQRAAPDDWKAAAWWLEKTFPDIYSKNKVSVEVSGPDGIPLQPTVTEKTTVMMISNEELKRMLDHEMLVNDLNALPEEDTDPFTVDTVITVVETPKTK